MVYGMSDDLLALTAVMDAKAARDQVRAILVADLRAMNQNLLSLETRAMLKADEVATAALVKAMRGGE